MYQHIYSLKDINIPELEEWINALKSGEYTQGVGQLRKDDKYCCLGVYCDLQAKKGLGEWRGNYFWHSKGGYTGTGGENVVLPPMNLIGTGQRNLPLFRGGGLLPMDALNDRVKLSFEEIAELLEGLLQEAKEAQVEI